MSYARIDAPKNAPTTLTINLIRPGITADVNTVAISQTVNISHNVPRQTMRLRSYRIQMAGTTGDANVAAYDASSKANALQAKVIAIRLPIFSDTQCIDNFPNYTTIQLPLDYSTVTLESSLETPVYMDKDLLQIFKIDVLEPYNVATAAFGTAAETTSVFTETLRVAALYLRFELEYGSLT